jgi:hypothetical protein
MSIAIDFKPGFAAKARKFFASAGRGTTGIGTVTAVAAAISIFAAALVLPTKSMADDPELRTFTVDVAFGLPYVQNNVDPAETAQNPNAFSPGDTFVQDGNIYPEGTIPGGASDFDPASPGAIGKYRARGTWTTDLEDFERAAAHKKPAAPDLAFVTEMFSFESNRGIILTDGTLPNAYFSARRVLLGGTGHFKEALGEVHEENIGENKLGFCNLRVTFKLRNTRNGDGASPFRDGTPGNN